ncbi:MAG: oxidoreductase [bacterium (Candidatus Stahlbacteria) CG23_combo_of_CG06-09_8_20_14_all_34_7]|nr:MAG: oxidoreductase [bacterium (Candidatus Stahlbacteria) CG23_combo_of_CG06-09_8_20_14_all_34_7]
MKTFSIIGYGYWGPNLLRVIDSIKGIKVKHVCDIDGKRLNDAKVKYPDYIYTKNVDMIFEDKEVNAIVLATPIETHYPLAMKAIEHGKDVFIEKPITGSTEEAVKLIKFAKEKKKIIMVGHTFVFSPPVRKMKEIVKSGELGKIFFITSSRVNLGIHRKSISVIWDLAPHDLSIIYYMLDEDPIEISASGRDSIIKGIPDVAFISLRFPSKIVANIELSWLAPTKMRRTVVVGSKKMLIYDDSDPVDKIKVYDKGIEMKEPQTFGEYQLTYRTGDMYAPRIDTSEPLIVEMESFLEAVKTRENPESDGDFGLRIVKTIELADKKLYDSL